MIDRLTDKVNGVTTHTWGSNFFIEPDNTAVEIEYQSFKPLALNEVIAILAAAKPDGTADPGRAKKLGRGCTVRPHFFEERVLLMRNLVLRKALDHAEFVDWLLETGDEDIEEGNWWHDNFWGRCFCTRCEGNGHAETAANALGKILMTVRGTIATWDEG